MKKVVKYINVLLFIFLLLLVSCKSEENISNTNNLNINQKVELSDTRLSLGTVCYIKIYGGNQEILNNCFNILDDITDSMAVNLKDSQIYKINELNLNEKFQVDSDLKLILDKSFEMSEFTKNYFDISLGSIVNLWQIGTDKQHLPNDIDISNALKSVGLNNIVWDGKYISRKNLDTKLDLGAIAKGFAADKVSEYLKSQNIKSAIINLGGNVELIGKKPDNSKFKVGIQDPRSDRNQYLGIVELENKTIVTSGDYERYFIENGRRYHHIFDRYTGYPSDKGIMAVAIIHNNSMEADALSTALFAMGKEEGMKLVESLHNVECMYITNDKELYATEGFKNVFTLTNSDYSLK